MSAAAKSSPVSHAVNLRVKPDLRALIDRAARSTGKTRTDFILDAASRAAEETLLDQVFIQVDAATFEFFKSVLDRPPSGEGFERLMRAPTPWKK